MKTLRKFLWFFISSIALYAAQINSLSSDKNIYNPSNTVYIRYNVNDLHKYKLKFTAFDTDNQIISPNNFSAVKYGEVSFIIPKTYKKKNIKINLKLIDIKNNIVRDSKDLILNINLNICKPEYTLLNYGDDSYTSLNLPFSFHGYRTIYPNTNGYITFFGGTWKYCCYVRKFNPMIWTSSSDLITSVHVTICTNKVKIRWSGRFYTSSTGFSSWVILNRDGTIEQSSGGSYGF